MANLRIHCPVKGAALVNCIHTLQLPLSQLQNKRVNFLPSKLGRKTICTTLVKLDRRAADKFYGQPQPSLCLRLQLQLQLVLFVGASQNLQRNSCRPTAVQPVCLLFCCNSDPVLANDSQTFTIYCTFAYKISPNSGHI